MSQPLRRVLRPEDPTILQLGAGKWYDQGNNRYSATLDIDPKALQWLLSVAVSNHDGILTVNIGGVIMRIQAEAL
jgi:hypothetical protein